VLFHILRSSLLFYNVENRKNKENAFDWTSAYNMCVYTPQHIHTCHHTDRWTNLWWALHGALEVPEDIVKHRRHGSGGHVRHRAAVRGVSTGVKIGILKWTLSLDQASYIFIYSYSSVSLTLFSNSALLLTSALWMQYKGNRVLFETETLSTVGQTRWKKGSNCFRVLDKARGRTTKLSTTKHKMA
jgi:hypothetical protein